MEKLVVGTSRVTAVSDFIKALARSLKPYEPLLPNQSILIHEVPESGRYTVEAINILIGDEYAFRRHMTSLLANWSYREETLVWKARVLEINVSSGQVIVMLTPEGIQPTTSGLFLLQRAAAFFKNDY